ncbi:MAG: exonuclease domain-containing protein [Thermaerobacter sp.]|nr:exonuclease domain-containing protein [Thermaerobacter sp.]
MLDDFLALDLETTGLDPEQDAILEVGAVRVRGGRLAEEFSALCRPTGEIPPSVQRLTGLTPELFRDAAPLEDVLEAFQNFAGRQLWVAHNASFDAAFLRRQGVVPTGGLVDTLELSQLLRPGRPSHRLNGGHRALDDARACARLLLELASQADALPRGLLERIRALVEPMPWDGRRLFLAASGGADSPVSRPGRPAPLAPNDEPEPEVAAVLEVFRSSLGAVLPGYEPRESQLSLAREVTAAFRERHILVAEAGTGTGKSLAYLIPAALWAMALGRRVVVATHTLTLQDQLREKDLPVAAAALHRPLRAAVLKGRGNYLCLQRLERLEGENLPFFPPEERLFLIQMLLWRHGTGSGDRAELPRLFGGDAAWEQVAAQEDNCVPSRCLHREECFFLTAKREAEAAHLVVVNHSLLLADLMAQRNVLPEYHHLVVDEAHHLPEAATRALGVELEELALRRTLQVLAAGRGARGRAAILAPLRRLGDDWSKRAAQVQGYAQEALQCTDELWQPLRRRLEDHGEGLAGQQTLRLTAPEEADGRRDAAVGALRRLERELSSVVDLLAEAEEDPFLQGELAALAAGVAAAGQAMAAVLEAAEADQVYWMELQRGGVVLRSAPLDPGQPLRALLFAPAEAAVLTSATMTVEGSFRFALERLGLDRLPSERVAAHAFGSPFRYREQAVLCVPEDLPDPRQADFLEQVGDFLAALLEVTRGRTLALFTSHQALRQVYARLQPVSSRLGLRLLGQGLDGSRSRLVEEFRAGGGTVLLGSASFWEGVDVPGEELSCVVLVRLPFQPPSHPVAQARCEALAHRGLSPFFHLSLPEAVTRFQQGFGRLIRRSDDRGVVIVVDPRLLPRSGGYGHRFLHSLPGPAFYRGPRAQVLEVTRRFLAGEGAGSILDLPTDQ